MARRNVLNFPDPIVAENIKNLIKEKGLTQQQFADCVFKERKAICSWVNEYSSPSAWDLKRICLTYGVSADEMLGIQRR